VCFVLLMLYGCEKFVGYNYETDPIPNTTMINGSISNIFTGEPVIYAQVRVGSQTTKTDQDGQYLMYYTFESDEDRNKPVDVVFSAPNYYSLSKSYIIYPGKNQFDGRLTYAAPLIPKTAFVQIDSVDTFLVCQALVFDYQGAEDIISVTASFIYFSYVKRANFFIERELEFMERYSDQASFYQVIYTPMEGEQFRFENRCSVIAIDREDYHCSVTLNLDFQNPDTLLFPWH
jgi:hypothetical protein